MGDAGGLQEAPDFLISENDIRLANFLLELGITLGGEHDQNTLLDKIVNESLALTHADGCTLYLIKDHELHFIISRNNSLGIKVGGTQGEPASFPPVPLNPTYVSAYAALNKKLVNISDVYESDEFDFAGPKKYDRMNNYKSKSMLVAPLTNHDDEVIGVLQLLNATSPVTGEVIPFNKKFEMIISSLASYAAMAITNTKLVEETRGRAAKLKEANLDAIYSLAMAAETKDDDTGDHVRRIQMYSMALSERIGLPPDLADEIGYSSIMHDVGKISVPDYILKKPAKLMEDEFGMMKLHALAGERILPSSDFFLVARNIARSHHEMWDGSGYPDGLAGAIIPLEARVVAVVDVFDALTNRRPYKKAWSFEDAMAEMKNISGYHFEPRLIDAWNDLYKEGAIRRIFEEWNS